MSAENSVPVRQYGCSSSITEFNCKRFPFIETFEVLDVFRSER